MAHHNLRLVPRSPSRNQERQPDAVQLFSRYSWHAAASYSPWDHEALIFERADAYLLFKSLLELPVPVVAVIQCRWRGAKDRLGATPVAA